MAAAPGRPGFAARDLPEWIWEWVESQRPELSQWEATKEINRLLTDADPHAPAYSRSSYRRHAALRQAQRLTLAAAQPATQHQTPAEPGAAPSAASIDSELGAGDPTPHAGDYPDASDGPSSPAQEQAADFSRSDEQPCSANRMRSSKVPSRASSKPYPRPLPPLAPSPRSRRPAKFSQSAPGRSRPCSSPFQA